MRTIIYTHIQKTCGSSITEVVKQQPGIVIWRRRPLTVKQPDFITGHIPYGIHNDWNDHIKSPYYATFLRDPIERWKSMFYHSLKKKHYSFHNLLTVSCQANINTDYEQNLTTEQINKFLRWCLLVEANSNIMCKQLTGTENLKNIIRWPNRNGPADQDFGFSQVYGWSGRYRITSPMEFHEMSLFALNNLILRYDFVGLQELGDVDQFRFCSHYGFKKVEGMPYHLTSSPRFREDEWFNSDNLELLAQLNQFDIKLYNDYKLTLERS